MSLLTSSATDASWSQLVCADVYGAERVRDFAFCKTGHIMNSASTRHRWLNTRCVSIVSRL